MQWGQLEVWEYKQEWRCPVEQQGKTWKGDDVTLCRMEPPFGSWITGIRFHALEIRNNPEEYVA